MNFAELDNPPFDRIGRRAPRQRFVRLREQRPVRLIDLDHCDFGPFVQRRRHEPTGRGEGIGAVAFLIGHASSRSKIFVSVSTPRSSR